MISREVIQLHATRLGERIRQGGCPYPDAALQANETFLRTLREDPGASVDQLREKHRKLQDRAGGWNAFLGFAGFAAAGAAALFGGICAPLPAYALAAASGAVAARLCLHLAGRHSAEAHRHETFLRHLNGWSSHDSDAAPKVPAWTGPMKISGLSFLTREFSKDLEGFPYAAELRAEHEHLLRATKGQADRSVEDVKADLLKQTRRPGHLPLAGRLVANAAWVAGITALAAGHPWVALGLGGTMAAGWGLRKLTEQVPVDPQRDARSLHYWQEAMAAVPLTSKPTDVLFDAKKPAEPAGTIEADAEKVQIGAVKVPVKTR